MAKISRSPIFHVNADDPEAVVKTMRMAVEYRQTFHCDVTVDLVCYRRHGHNEQDSPEITAPVMYHFINQHPTAVSLYRKRLEQQGVLAAADYAAMSAAVEAHLAAEYQLSRGAPSSWDTFGDITGRRSDWFDKNDVRSRAAAARAAHESTSSTSDDQQKEEEKDAHNALNRCSRRSGRSCSAFRRAFPPTKRFS